MERTTYYLGTCALCTRSFIVRTATRLNLPTLISIRTWLQIYLAYCYLMFP
jgi:hypothetical protein